jgi:hypothetical protein
MGIWDILHMTIWYILYSFGTFFPGLFQEKSGNPASGPNCKKARLLGTIQQCTIVFGLHSTFVYRFYRFHRIYRLYRFIILISVKTCIWSYVQCANTCAFLSGTILLFFGKFSPKKLLSIYVCRATTYVHTKIAVLSNSEGCISYVYIFRVGSF